MLPLDKSRRGCFDRYGLGNGYAGIGILCCILQCRTLRYKGHGLQPIHCACRVEGWYFALVLRRFFGARGFWHGGVAIRFIDAGRKGGRGSYRFTSSTLSSDMRRNTGLGRGGACRRDFVGVSPGGEVLLPLDKIHRSGFDRHGLVNLWIGQHDGWAMAVENSAGSACDRWRGGRFFWQYRIAFQPVCGAWHRGSVLGGCNVGGN